MYLDFLNDFWSWFLFIYYIMFPLSEVFLKYWVVCLYEEDREREKFFSISTSFRILFQEIIP